MIILFLLFAKIETVCISGSNVTSAPNASLRTFCLINIGYFSTGEYFFSINRLFKNIGKV